MKSSRFSSDTDQKARLAFFTKLVPEYVTTQLVNNTGSSDGAYGFSGLELFDAAVGFFDISGFSALADKLDRDEQSKGYGSPAGDSRELGASQFTERRRLSKVSLRAYVWHCAIIVSFEGCCDADAKEKAERKERMKTRGVHTKRTHSGKRIVRRVKLKICCRFNELAKN